MFPSLPSFAAALSQPFKRSQLGLFHGKTKQYGNNVPFSKKKTRRSWLPNIQNKRLFSDALGENVRVKLTTRALKTIRKVCGFPSNVLLFIQNEVFPSYLTMRICLLFCLYGIVWWTRPVCTQHKIRLAWLGRHATTRRRERGTGEKSIRGILFSTWRTHTWCVSYRPGCTPLTCRVLISAPAS